jgi:hypothetical protein
MPGRKMKNASGELHGFVAALSVGLPAGILTWLAAYGLALLLFPQFTGIDLPRLSSWL